MRMNQPTHRHQFHLRLPKSSKLIFCVETLGIAGRVRALYTGSASYDDDDDDEIVDEDEPINQPTGTNST